MAYLYAGTQKVTPVIIRDYQTITVSGATPTVSLENYTIYNAGTLTSLTIALPSSNIPTDFIAQINFTSGSTPTVVNADGIKWFGDNVNEDTGFIARANCEYSIMIYYSNSSFRGVIQGSSIS